MENWISKAVWATSVLVMALVLGTTIGCKLFENNPDAPPVQPPIGRPDGWPVYKGTNEASSNATVLCNGAPRASTACCATNMITQASRPVFGCATPKSR
jgi:hypothetical protein